jgi:hypothetical protein
MNRNLIEGPDKLESSLSAEKYSMTAKLNFQHFLCFKIQKSFARIGPKVRELDSTKAPFDLEKIMPRINDSLCGKLDRLQSKNQYFYHMP